MHAVVSQLLNFFFFFKYQCPFSLPVHCWVLLSSFSLFPIDQICEGDTLRTDRYIAYLVFILSVQKSLSQAAQKRNKKIISTGASWWCNLNREHDVHNTERRLDLDCCSLNVKPERDTKDALLRLCTFLRVKSKAFNSRNTTFMILRLLMCTGVHILPSRQLITFWTTLKQRFSLWPFIVADRNDDQKYRIALCYSDLIAPRSIVSKKTVRVRRLGQKILGYITICDLFTLIRSESRHVINWHPNTVNLVVTIFHPETPLLPFKLDHTH